MDHRIENKKASESLLSSAFFVFKTGKTARASGRDYEEILHGFNFT